MTIATFVARGRYRLGVALYARWAGPTQLKAKLKWVTRWLRWTAYLDLALQCSTAILVGWASRHWSVANGSPQAQSDLLMFLSMAVFLILWESANRWRKHRRALQGKPEAMLGEWVGQQLSLPFRVSSDERGNAMMVQLRALQLPYHHAFCMLECEARLVLWLWKGLSAQTLRADQLDDQLPEPTAVSKPKPRF